MDWNEIETFLQSSIYGTVILSIIGGLILLLILNIVGRANKGIKNLWVYYSIGNKASRDLMFDSVDYYEFVKYQALQAKMNVILFSVGLASHIDILVVDIIFLVFIYVNLLKSVRYDHNWKEVNKTKQLL